MNPTLVALFALVVSSFRTRSALQTEVLALRHQLAILQGNASRRLHLQGSDRLLWILLSRLWSGWRICLPIVQPATVNRLAPQSLRLVLDAQVPAPAGYTKLSRGDSRPIRRMSQANPLWGAPCIHSELLKLGIKVAVHGCQVSVTPAQAALPDLAHLSYQPHQSDGRNRLLHRADSHLPRSVCLSGPVP